MVAQPLIWRLRRLPVCASTEIELSRWLAERQRTGRPLPRAAEPLALAVVSGRQRFGVGQQGRFWHSPAGGLWLSAAIPWPAEPQASAPLALAASVTLALGLERLGLAPRIKWPNDLLIDGRKLAGVLPRLRWRAGGVRWAQLGIGINGVNRPPPGAIALAEALAPGSPRRHPAAQPRQLLPLVLEALSLASAQAPQAGPLLAAAEARLWCPAGGWPHEGRTWRLAGLTASGGLRLERPGASRTLERQVEPVPST